MISVDQYFRNTFAWNDKFFQRFEMPNLTGKRVLDFGSGVGSLTIGLAQAGSAQAIGFDPDAERIATARRILARDFPELSDRVEFVTEFDDPVIRSDGFDYVFSRDTFEHVQDLEGVLEVLWRCLKPDGKVYAGFGPLYNSPFGDHGLLQRKLPWGHLIFHPGLRGRRSRQQLSPNEVVVCRELNLLTLADYLNAFQKSRLHVESIRFNVSSHPAMKVLRVLRSVPMLREWCTCSIYAVLTKPVSSSMEMT